MNSTEHWRRQAGQLASRLKTDWKNGLMLRSRWPRAAHSMVQGWRIRISRPPAKGTQIAPPKETWKQFARSAMSVAATRASHAKRSDWHLWATRRVSGGSRYIPKAKRTW